MPKPKPPPRSATPDTTIVQAEGRAVGLRVRGLVLDATAGPASGATARLTGRELGIGSDPTNALTLADPTVSRFHCRVVAGEDGVRIVDRGSANGTYVDGMRVRDAYLGDGAMLALGDTTVRVRLDADAPPVEIELSPEDHFGGVVGRSVAMRELFAVARRAAAAMAPVLLLGETGTGKDLLARAIHDHSPRAAGPFLVFDCGAVAPTLIEAALFGHVRGAFTGADADRPGVFEAASGGTLLLDEIGELALTLQPKLLRALESNTVTRVGATAPLPIDVRVVAATNRDLFAEVEAERFRADLFYRLAVIPIEVPALRDRKGDIPLLAAHFLRHLLSADGHDLAWLRPHLDDAFRELTHHRWPGNVRELRNVIERAAALADPRELAKDGFARLFALRTSIGATLHARPTLEQARETFDREYLRDVLAAAQNDLRAAAQMAGVHPKSLERLLRRYGMART